MLSRGRRSPSRSSSTPRPAGLVAPADSAGRLRPNRSLLAVRPAAVGATVAYRLKVALTVGEEFRVTVQEPVPEQPPPLQPPKDPVVGVAVSVTTVPGE